MDLADSVVYINEEAGNYKECDEKTGSIWYLRLGVDVQSHDEYRVGFESV